MATSPSLECDLVDAASGQALRTVRLPVVPRAGEELELDVAAGDASGLYRVVQVRYHVRPRKLVRTDDLFGVTVFVAPAG